MEKIKQFLDSEHGKDILIVVIVILVGLGSFELGRLSKENGPSGVKIEYQDQNENQTASAVSSVESVNKTAPLIQSSNVAGKNYFASSRGSKYYSIGCSAGKTIKQENRIYFGTSDEAERAGYMLSSSCN
jgi:hypothetical protein